MANNVVISIVVPVFNEEANIRLIYDELIRVMSKVRYDFEILFVDDGSSDNSPTEMERLSSIDPHVHYLQFSRNFGKEAATSAGISEARGDAVIMIDCDLQHPPEVILEFLSRWEGGAEVVIGVRNRSRSDGAIRKIGSYLFYKIMNAICGTKIVPQSTDFRLIDRKVADEFNRFTEKKRLTRGLIDWLGFRRELVFFDADERRHGAAGYSLLKLFDLALSSVVSLSFLPLKFAGYLGVLIVLISGPLGIFIFVQRYIVNDPWGLKFSGPATLAVIIMFLIGIVLICLGLIALYIGNIQTEVNNRPMYIVRNNSDMERFHPNQL